jgi:hypothetical protein
MRGVVVAGLAATVAACAASAPPTSPPLAAPALPPPADVVFDFEASGGRAIDRAVTSLRTELGRSHPGAEVVARGNDTVVVRGYRGDLEALIATAGGRRSVWVAPTALVDLRYLAEPLPPGVDAQELTDPAGKEVYARSIAADESALRAWIASTHPPAGHVVLIGDDLLDPGYVRTYVVSRTPLASNFDTTTVRTGTDDDGAFADVFVGDAAAPALVAWTSANIGRRIAAVSHGRVLTAPIVRVPARNEKLGARLRFGFGRDAEAHRSANDFSALWRAPASDSGLRLRGVDPALY